ncbi:hypothetical protein EDB80DRAFT_742326 [Ilyonectria destructans]|nr:hypothetical protein EDB80DRAFT_742326 [Ilyonectria destructans]
MAHLQAPLVRALYHLLRLFGHLLPASGPRRLLSGEAGVLSTDTACLPYYTFAYVSLHIFTTTDMASRQRLSSWQGTASTGKSVAQQCHTSKRAITRASSRHGHTSMHGTMTDRPQRKVRKACVRCRMKKMKCDSEIPCKRCKDDECVCTASVRRTIAYKQTPRGYAEVLEHTQYILIATVCKLYGMVRNSQLWEVGEPQLNDRGQPVVQDIAQMLGCIRPNSDVDLPVHSVFPEDVTGMEELCRELEEQERYESASTPSHARDTKSPCNRLDETVLLEPDDLGIEQGYCGIDFGIESAMKLLRQQLSTTSDNLEFDGTASADMNGNAPFPDTAHSPFTWSMPDTQRSDLTMCFLQKAGTLQSMDVLDQGLVEYEFDAMEPHILSYNSEARHGGTP